MTDVEALLSEYWDLAYAEGKEARDHDTEAGDAERVRSAILDHIAALQEQAEKAEAERDAAKVEARLAWSSDEHQAVWADLRARAEAAELRLKIYEEEDARINAEFVAIAETALKEAEEVIRPFAASLDLLSKHFLHSDNIRGIGPDTAIGVGHLRAARRWKRRQ